MSLSATYLLGTLIIVAGLALAAYLLDVPIAWIVGATIGVIVLGGLLVARRARRRARYSASR